MAHQTVASPANGPTFSWLVPRDANREAVAYRLLELSQQVQAEQVDSLLVGYFVGGNLWAGVHGGFFADSKLIRQLGTMLVEQADRLDKSQAEQHIRHPDTLQQGGAV